MSPTISEITDFSKKYLLFHNLKRSVYLKYGKNAKFISWVCGIRYSPMISESFLLFLVDLKRYLFKLGIDKSYDELLKIEENIRYIDRDRIIDFLRRINL